MFFTNPITILKEINQPFLLLATILLVVIIILWIIKLGLFKSFGFIELLCLLTTISLAFIFYPLDKIYIYLGLSFLILLLGYSIYLFYLSYKRHLIRKERLFNHIKNSNFDYYLSTTSNDRIVDTSVSFAMLTGLSFKVLKKAKAINILIDYFDIVKINKKPIDDEIIRNFKIDYQNARYANQEYKFEIEALMKGVSENYRGLIQPIYDGKKYLGKNIYLNKDLFEVFNLLREDLLSLSLKLEDAKGQNHILMSLSNQTALYYDFQTKTYVATALFTKMVANQQSEYSFEEYINMIHPQDLDYYINQASTINSLSTTKIVFRLLVNNEYYKAIENSIYLEKERGLVSVIHLLERLEGQFREEEKPSVMLSELDELENLRPESSFQAIDDILATTLGKKNE